jgi:hypothetical protein
LSFVTSCRQTYQAALEQQLPLRVVDHKKVVANKHGELDRRPGEEKSRSVPTFDKDRTAERTATVKASGSN